MNNITDRSLNKKNPIEFYRSLLTNPFLEALPAFGSTASLKAALSSGHITPDDEVRGESVDHRLHFLSQLRTLHVPLGRDVELAHMIRDILADRYAACMPVATYVESQRDRVDAFTRRALSKVTTDDYEATGHSLTGPSGLGKTRTIKRVLRLFPQCHVFDPSKNPALPPKIVIWIRVECPSNRTESALIDAIFTALELAMGEKIPKELRGKNISQSIEALGQIVDDLRLGLLVLDEIQHALRANMLPDRALMNFLVSLGNTLNVPILMIGTPAAKHVVGREMRQARRMIGPSWDVLKKDSKGWKELIAGMQPMQFTKRMATCEFLEEHLFDRSQGIPAIAMLLFRYAQRYALLAEMEDEQIDEGILNAVTEDFFGIIEPMINAMKTGDKDHLALFEDLFYNAELDDSAVAELVKQRTNNRNILVKAATNAGRKGAALIKQQTLRDAMVLSGPGGLDPKLLSALREVVQSGTDPAHVVAALATAKGK